MPLDDEMFQLDRKGGQDKILKATYTPKSYRGRYRTAYRLTGWKIFGVWAVILSIIFGVAFLVEKKGHAGTSIQLILK